VPGCAVSDEIWPRLDTFKQHVARMHDFNDYDAAEDMWVLYDPEVHDSDRTKRFKQSAQLSKASATQISAPTAIDSGYHSGGSNRMPTNADTDKSTSNLMPGDKTPTWWYARTQYSDGASLETTRRDNFVEKFAETLVQSLGGGSMYTDAAARLRTGIQELLADLRLAPWSGSLNSRDEDSIDLHTQI